MVELQNSLKLADQQNDDAVKAVKEEERKMANEAINKLNSEHENAIVKVGTKVGMRQRMSLPIRFTT